LLQDNAEPAQGPLGKRALTVHLSNQQASLARPFKDALAKRQDVFVQLQGVRARLPDEEPFYLEACLLDDVIDPTKPKIQRLPANDASVALLTDLRASQASLAPVRRKDLDTMERPHLTLSQIDKADIYFDGTVQVRSISGWTQH
jgi:hypothetical protein